MLVVLATVVGPPGSRAAEGVAPWNLGTQQVGRTFNTEVNVMNVSCRGAHDFTVAIEGDAASFLRLVLPPGKRVEDLLKDIRPGQTKSVPAQLDLRSISPGVHNGGTVVTRCLDCRASCRLDKTILPVHLTVTGAPIVEQETTAVTEAASEEEQPAGGEDAPFRFDPSDPDTQDAYTFLPRVGCGWDVQSNPGKTLMELDGTFVFSPVLFQASGAGGTVIRPGTAAGAGAAAVAVAQSAPRQPLTTQARELCLENLGPCDELLAKAREAESKASGARARADRATGDEEYDRSVADSTEDEIEADKGYIANMRRQAAEWRDLAESARTDARTNRARAQRQPSYAESWMAEARRDEARAARRDANAARLDAEADRLEGRTRNKQDRADERRGQAEAARAEAAALEEEARLARAAYEACVEQQRLECERKRREEIRAARARAAAEAEASRAATTTGSDASSGGATTDPNPRGWMPNWESLPPRQSEYCEWNRYNVPRGATVDFVAVRAANRRDTVSALEVRRMKTSESTVGQGFDYHCKATSGSAVIIFRVSHGGTKRYKLRIGCTE
jgi:hypothetical protein